MLFDSYKQVTQNTKLEFAPWLADKHQFVKLRSGKWTRVLGAPSAKGCLPGTRVESIGARKWRIVSDAR